MATCTLQCNWLDLIALTLAANSSGDTELTESDRSFWRGRCLIDSAEYDIYLTRVEELEQDGRAILERFDSPFRDISRRHHTHGSSVDEAPLPFLHRVGQRLRQTQRLSAGILGLLRRELLWRGISDWLVSA